jgi:hypothetical protein
MKKKVLHLRQKLGFLLDHGIHHSNCDPWRLVESLFWNADFHLVLPALFKCRPSFGSVPMVLSVAFPWGMVHPFFKRRGLNFLAA